MTTPRSATARPNMPVPTGRRIERTQSRLRWLRMPGVMGEAEVPGRRVEEVDHRPVGFEQPGGLGDRRLELVVDLAVPAVRIVTLRWSTTGVAAVDDRRARAGWPSRDGLRGRAGGRGGRARAC